MKASSIKVPALVYVRTHGRIEPQIWRNAIPDVDNYWTGRIVAWHPLAGGFDGLPISDLVKLFPPPGAVRATRTAFDLVAHLYRQRAFSLKTFGPGARTQGGGDHIVKELREIAKAPLDLEEWIDVVLLALDGAHRAGHDPEAICAGLEAKQTKNEGRNWPDWRTADPDKAIEHVRNEKETA